jgi:hypothetical protein
MSTRHAATVLSLPGAASAPVQQSRSRGRYPSGITTIKAHLRKKIGAEIDKETQESDRILILEELEMQRRLEAIDAKARANRAWKIMRMTTPPKNDHEKRELEEILAEIKWWKLPFEERQRIEALQQGRGQVLSWPNGSQ